MTENSLAKYRYGIDRFLNHKLLVEKRLLKIGWKLQKLQACVLGDCAEEMTEIWLKQTKVFIDKLCESFMKRHCKK